MNVRTFVSQALVVVGVLAMLLGAFDPLEGSLAILPGSFLVALGAMLGKASQRWVLLAAFGLVALGVGALFALSAWGGVGGTTGRSMWWLLTVLPYPVGWLMGLGGVIAMVGRGWQRRLVGSAAALSVFGLGALILLASQGLGREHWLIIAFVLVPHVLALLTMLSGGVLWMKGSARAQGA